MSTVKPLVSVTRLTNEPVNKEWFSVRFTHTRMTAESPTRSIIEWYIREKFGQNARLRESIAAPPPVGKPYIDDRGVLTVTMTAESGRIWQLPRRLPGLAVWHSVWHCYWHIAGSGNCQVPDPYMAVGSWQFIFTKKITYYTIWLPDRLAVGSWHSTHRNNIISCCPYSLMA
jgi:hypothetical protein